MAASAVALAAVALAAVALPEPTGAVELLPVTDAPPEAVVAPTAVAPDPRRFSDGFGASVPLAPRAAAYPRSAPKSVLGFRLPPLRGSWRLGRPGEVFGDLPFAGGAPLRCVEPRGDPHAGRPGEPEPMA